MAFRELWAYHNSHGYWIDPCYPHSSPSLLYLQKHFLDNKSLYPSLHFPKVMHSQNIPIEDYWVLYFLSYNWRYRSRAWHIHHVLLFHFFHTTTRRNPHSSHVVVSKEQQPQHLWVLWVLLIFYQDQMSIVYSLQSQEWWSHHTHDHQW